MKKISVPKNFIRIFISAALGCLILLVVFKIVKAATNIDSVNRWAWNDLIGWIDFYGPGTVNVSSQNLSGYASSSAGDISLDCATTRAGDICYMSNYRVTNDGTGNLAGWGWNDIYGWISFCGGQSTSSCPGTTIYQVKINGDTGDFRDYAWNDIAGWISFCGTPGDGSGCASTTNAYKVNTSWRATSTSGYLDSSVYDTGVAGGAQLNSVLWQGELPSDTSVRFKFAASNSSSGPWEYLGPQGTTSPDDYYGPVSPNVSYRLNYILHSDKRYFRYRVILVSDQAQRKTPRIDDIIVNWSP
jgi:hypothetical protein